MEQHHHRSNAVYAIALIVALSLAFSLGANSGATGFVVGNSREISVRITGLEQPQLGERLELTFSANGIRENERVFFSFMLMYPDGKRSTQIEEFSGRLFLAGPITVGLPWKPDKTGLYKLTVTADPGGRIPGSGGQDSRDEIIFRI